MTKYTTEWPNGPTTWIVDRELFVSVPFTWNLLPLRAELRQRSMLWDHATVGGPAVRLMGELLDDLEDVTVSRADMPGVLQRVNPMATRTTTGCVNRCAFCAVPKTEGPLRLLAEWPARPVVCDNNILAAPVEHFDRVLDMLDGIGWGDFNQGIDARLLTDYHAERLSRAKVMCRLALDHPACKDAWENAYAKLRAAGVAKSRIRAYVLCGFDSDPAECWDRCNWVQGHGVYALPQWFHDLDAMQHNAVTAEQRANGWDNEQRGAIMGYFYKHRGKNLGAAGCKGVDGVPL
jgi:hypothetical protein